MTSQTLIDAAGTGPMITYANSVLFGYASLEEAFPTIDPGVKPLGNAVIIQIRHPKRKTSGGIILSSDLISTEYYNTQVGKVVAMGPMAFKTIMRSEDRETGVVTETVGDWPEGAWFKTGDYVRFPKFGGDRFMVSFSQDGEKEEYAFVMFKAKDILGLITGDPLSIKAFLD